MGFVYDTMNKTKDLIASILRGKELNYKKDLDHY